MNPIFIEYYSHEQSECYKIRLPWTNYAEEKLVLCPVAEGYEKARSLAQEAIAKHFKEATVRPPDRRADASGGQEDKPKHRTPSQILRAWIDGDEPVPPQLRALSFLHMNELEAYFDATRGQSDPPSVAEPQWKSLPKATTCRFCGHQDCVCAPSTGEPSDGERKGEA